MNGISSESSSLLYSERDCVKSNYHFHVGKRKKREREEE